MADDRLDRLEQAVRTMLQGGRFYDPVTGWTPVWNPDTRAEVRHFLEPRTEPRADEPDPEPGDEGLSAARRVLHSGPRTGKASAIIADLQRQLNRTEERYSDEVARAEQAEAERDDLRERAVEEVAYLKKRLDHIEDERDKLQGRLEQIRTWARGLSRIDWRDLGPASTGILSLAAGNVPELGRET